MTAGTNAANQITRIFALSPRPSQTIARGIQASGGMGRMSRKAGLMKASKRRLRPMAIPKGTPVKTAKKNPSTTSRKLYKHSVMSVPPAYPRLMICKAATSTSVGLGKRWRSISWNRSVAAYQLRKSTQKVAPPIRALVLTLLPTFSLPLDRCLMHGWRLDATPGAFGNAIAAERKKSRRGEREPDASKRFLLNRPQGAGYSPRLSRIGVQRGHEQKRSNGSVYDCPRHEPELAERRNDRALAAPDGKPPLEVGANAVNSGGDSAHDHNYSGQREHPPSERPLQEPPRPIAHRLIAARARSEQHGCRNSGEGHVE